MSTTETGILKLSARSKNKLLGVAVASGLAAASLGGVGPAHAWCAGLSGINFGEGCTSTLGNFALGLGPTAEGHSNGLSVAIALGDAVADSTGILTAAWAGGSSRAVTQGIANVAVAQGTNVFAQAGFAPFDFLNFAFDFGNATAPA